MRTRNIFATIATVASLSGMAGLASAQGIDDPRRADYFKVYEGKTIAFVPVTMGIDLTEGWASVLKKQADTLGMKLEIRDPHFSADAGAQAITSLISEKPDVLIVHSPDLNSYARLLKKAQAAGTYVILIDNPANFAADAFVGSDWDRLGQLEAEAVIKGCGPNSSKKIGLVQGDQVNASSLYQYAGITKVLAKNPDFQVVAKPDSNWDATTSRNVTTTMLQQHPDICGIIDFWDGDASGAAAAIRDAKLQDKVFLVTTGGGEKAADCDNLENGTYGAVVMTELHHQSRDINAIIKFLLQSGQPAGTSKAYIYTLEKATTKADLKPDSCWDLKALKTAAK